MDCWASVQIAVSIGRRICISHLFRGGWKPLLELLFNQFSFFHSNIYSKESLFPPDTQRGCGEQSRWREQSSGYQRCLLGGVVTGTGGQLSGDYRNKSFSGEHVVGYTETQDALGIQVQNLTYNSQVVHLFSWQFWWPWRDPEWTSLPHLNSMRNLIFDTSSSPLHPFTFLGNPDEFG